MCSRDGDLDVLAAQTRLFIIATTFITAEKNKKNRIWSYFVCLFILISMRHTFNYISSIGKMFGAYLKD